MEPDFCVACDTKLEKGRCPECDPAPVPEVDPIEEVEVLKEEDILDESEEQEGLARPKFSRIPPPRRLSQFGDFDPVADKPKGPPQERNRKIEKMYEKLQDLLRDRIVHAQNLRDIIRGDLKRGLKELTPDEKDELRTLTAMLIETYREMLSSI
jgi:hypothetical protein